MFLVMVNPLVYTYRNICIDNDRQITRVTGNIV